jgi:hypothetical protein
MAGLLNEPPLGGFFGFGLMPHVPVDPNTTILANALARATYLRPPVYKPGERVNTSGIYRVVHDTHHIQPHQVTCVAGEVFPPCRDCGSHPRFTLEQAAVHIGNSELFRR